MIAEVGVNLLWLRPGAVGGTESYVTAVLRALAGAPPRVAIRLFALPGFGRAHPDLAAAFPLRTAPLPAPARAARVAFESTWLAAAGRGLDLLHHAGGTVPPLRTVPPVVTIHDLQYLTFPETFSAVKLRYLRALVPHAARHARVVMTTSEFVRGTVIDAFGVDPDRVAVVPPVVVAPPSEGRDLDQVLDRHGLRRPYVVYPTAAAYPHKNHAVLLDALPDVPDVDLVCTGAGWATGSDLSARAERLGVSQRVRHVGHVDGADLDGLYRGALATVFPSRYEGFGMAVLEAMARGCPVLAADTTALPDTVGGGGLLLDPDDPSAWAKAIAEVVGDPELRDRLSRAAAQRAAAFTPEATAAAQVTAYERALALGPRS